MKNTIKIQIAKRGFSSIFFDKEEYNLVFIGWFGKGDQEFDLQQFKMPQIVGNPRVSYLGESPRFRFDIEEQSKQRDRRLWYLIHLLDLPLKSFSAEVTVQWRKFDGDDVKVLVNREVKKDPKKWFRQNWIWASSPFRGRTKERKTFEENLLQGNHHIELWADQQPILHTLQFDCDGFKRIPSQYDPMWTNDFRDDPEDILLARLLLGEAENQSRETKIWIAGSVFNRVMSPAWADNIRDVILKPNQYDPFKPTDHNFSKIMDPLGTQNVGRIGVWRECLVIARGMLAGRIKNPTTATHFHAVGVTREWFEKNVVPRGRFLRKIDDTYFYESPN